MVQCFGSRKGMLALSLVLFLSRAVQGFLPFPAVSSSRSRSLPARVFLSATAPVEGPDQRFDRLLEEMLRAEDIERAAVDRANEFDYDFMKHLMGRTQAARSQEEAETLTRVGAAVSLAMQIQIQKADALLRKILQSGDIKVMEATMRRAFKTGELSVAFDVVLQVNLQNAKEDADSEAAAKLLGHLNTVLMEEREKKLPSPVQLLRKLLRTDCDGARKSMLEGKLVLPTNQAPSLPVIGGEGDGQLPMWGMPEVQPSELLAALADFRGQIAPFATEVENDVLSRCSELEKEINDVVANASVGSV